MQNYCKNINSQNLLLFLFQKIHFLLLFPAILIIFVG